MFEAVINWVKHSKKEREASLPELLQYVRMPLLTPRYITDVIDTEVQQPLPAPAWALLPPERLQSSFSAATLWWHCAAVPAQPQHCCHTELCLLCQQSQHPALQPQGALSRAISQLSLQISTAPFSCHLLQSPSAFCLHS